MELKTNMNATDKWLDQLLKTSALAVLGRYEADKITRELAKEHAQAIDLWNALLEQEHFPSAVEYLAYWLPTSYSVWWGCLCVWEANRESETSELIAIMQLIIQWLHTPNEDARKNLEPVQRWLPTNHPVNLLSKAVFFSGGSLAAEEFDVVPPPPYLPCVFVTAAIMLIAATALPTQHTECYQKILQLGQEVLLGTNHWSDG